MKITAYLQVKKINIAVIHNKKGDFSPEQKCTVTKLQFIKRFICILLLLLPAMHVESKAPNHNGLMELSDGWQFYPGSFLTAREMKQLKTGETYQAILPQSWSELKMNGKPIPVMGIGTYYKQVIISHSGINDIDIYGLHIGIILSAYKVLVNDKPVLVVGNPTTSKEGFVPYITVNTCNFSCYADTVDIVLQISNFYYPKYSGLFNYRKILFGKAEDINRYNFQKDSYLLFLLSFLLFMFLVQVVFGFVNRKERTHFLIAAFCLFAIYHTLRQGEILLFSFFPDFNLTLSYKLWYLDYSSVIFILRITRLSYPKQTNKYIEHSFYILYAILIPVFMVCNMTFLFNYSLFLSIPTFICILYILYILYKAIINRQSYSILYTISFGILCISIASDILHAQSIHFMGYIYPIGVLVFIIIQSSIIFLRFARSYDVSIKLSRELESTNRNLELIVNSRIAELKRAYNELIRMNKENMELAEIKNKMLQRELSKKEREMITAAVGIFQNKKMLSAIKEDVFNEKIKFNEEQTFHLNEIVEKYDNLANSFNWQLFEKRFTELNKEFYVNMIKDFPGLTAGELKLCAFFRIGLSLKEISMLNYSNYETVRKSTYRIRKKIGLDKNIKLSIFLQGY